MVTPQFPESSLSLPHQGKPEPLPDGLTENGPIQTITAEPRVSLTVLRKLPSSSTAHVLSYRNHTNKPLIRCVPSTLCLLMSAMTH